MRPGSELIGRTLSHFRVTAKLGQGGMGEVYRASDIRLGRDVALKVLPDDFTADAERLVRFQREARLLASLNHPSIAAIYGLEEVDGKQVIVLELAEGEDLTERIARGPLPLDEALQIALQIAEAVESAHEKAIIHRDLKPANVKLSADGRVKVLDFGLAKALDAHHSAPSGPSLSQSPTMVAQTSAGVLLGTASYMSPEQARGRAADRRADVWAFGVVLFEMLAGRRLFEGETVSDILAAVLRADLDWTKLPPETPASIRRLLMRCLQRDPRRRLPDIGAARLEIQELLAGEIDEAIPATAVPAAHPAAPAWRRHLPWALAGLLLVATLALVVRLLEATRRPESIVRASIRPPDKSSFWLETASPGLPVLSPDGTKLVFGVIDSDNKVRLYLRRLDGPEARALPGSEDADYPFWSPDGRSIGFFAGDKLKTIAVEGGAVLTVCRVLDGKGGSWSRDGVIVFAPTYNGPLQRVPAAGGAPAPFTRLDEKRGDASHRHPRFLPDGRHVLYLAATAEPNAEGFPVVLASLDGGPEKMLLRSPAAAAYASGHILFLREKTLMARPFDTGRLAFTGDAFAVVDNVSLLSVSSAIAVFSASDTGRLVFLTAGRDALTKLDWRARDGAALGTLGEPGDILEHTTSPDGARVAVILKDAAAGTRDIWIVDSKRGLKTRFTFDPASESSPVFSPDGRTLYYASRRKRQHDLYRKAIDGSSDEEVLFESDLDKRPLAISPDGRFLAFMTESAGTLFDVWILPLEGNRKPVPFLTTKAIEYACAFSPDGKWLAYGSDESGPFHVYVTSFPRPGRKWQVSSEPASYASWSSDGKEIVVHGDSGRLWAVPVRASGDGLEIGSGKALFKLDGPPISSASVFSAVADHTRFLVRSRADRSEMLLDLLVDWPAAARNAAGR